jgi:hypothetical protein
VPSSRRKHYKLDIIFYFIVTFNATVMAAVIAEATIDADEDQFIGASFGQLQDVDDMYENNEPDIVCYAHIIDNNNHADHGIPNPVNGSNVDISPHREFDLIMYLTSQRVNNSGDVRVVHYDRNRPDLISHEYNSPCDGSIIDYTDTLQLKLKMAGIHSSTDLMTFFEDRTIIEACNIFKLQLKDVDQKGLCTSTVRLLKEETLRYMAHGVYNSIWYNQMIDETGIDDEPEIFPATSILLHHVISAVAINHHRHKPNRWMNRVTLKLINCGVSTIKHLESKIRSDTLNDHIHQFNVPQFHQVTIYGFKLILGMADFCQGRF